MPNVEIHGLPLEEARRTRSVVFNLLKGRSYVWDMVVTIYPTEVENRKGDSQPFFRLANSHEEISEEIIEVLHHMGMDVEYLRLDKFIPAKEKQDKG